MNRILEPRGRMKQAIYWIAALGLTACAPMPRTGASGASPAFFAASPRVDAVLPSGRNLFVFDFSQSRYQKWNLVPGSGDTLGGCRVLDTLAGDWAHAANWLALSSPTQPFIPMLAAWGPNGNFFLLDRGGKRLGMYDTSAQFLSGFPLPEEIRDRNLDRFEVFWTRDGQFSFLDLGEGKVWQYAELKGASGQGEWRLRNAVPLPLGLETCLWEPYFRNPCCVQAGKGVCFDAYFNPVGPWPGESDASGMRPRAPSGSREWTLILTGASACASRPSVCYQSDKAAFSPCPTETDAAPPR